MKRGRPEVVGDVRPRAGTDQEIGNGEVVTMRRAMERRCAVTLRRIHIDSDRALLQQLAHRFNVSLLDRLDQPQVCRGGHAECGCDGRKTIAGHDALETKLSTTEDAGDAEEHTGHAGLTLRVHRGSQVSSVILPGALT